MRRLLTSAHNYTAAHDKTQTSQLNRSRKMARSLQFTFYQFVISAFDDALRH